LSPAAERSSRKESTLDRILSALNHPVRRRILRSLADKKASASMLSREFEMDLGVVSYHLNQVLARECGVIELVDAVPKRGALEKIYELKPEVWSDLPPAAAAKGGSTGGLRMLSLGECLLEAVEAMDGETFALLEGSAWEWFPATVDSEAWEAIGKAREQFNQAVAAAVAASQERDAGRNGAAEKHGIVVGAAAFPAANAMPDA
jgi:DNA-binding transcriptional ArsR family regulator